MKQSSLEVVCCPFCKSTLSPNAPVENGIIKEGELLCADCNRSYPVKNGIVHFIDPQELEGANKQFAQYYDRLAPMYSLFTKLAFLPFGGERKARREILQHLDPDTGRILEVSIGNGVNLPYLLQSSDDGEVFGIDISIGQLSQCQRLIEKRGWQVDLFLAMAEALPFRDETFDNVLHIGGINFFSGKQKSIHEMARVVRVEGKVVIADEAERVAKQVNRSFSPSSEGGAIENTIQNLVPDTMQDIRVDGIWKAHGRHHGYCMEFTKPK